MYFSISASSLICSAVTSTIEKEEVFEEKAPLEEVAKIEVQETKEEVVNTTNYSNVNFKQNTRTNVISNNLLTGTINYTISLDNDFASFDDDNEINGEFPKQDGNGSSSN